jgi:hypothetical protein
MRGPDRGEPCPKLLLHRFRVCSGQRVLDRQIPLRPGRRLVRRIYSRSVVLIAAVPISIVRVQGRML